MIDSGEKATAALAGENVKKLRPGVDGACVLFSVVIILFVLLGYRIQSREFYSGILITEFMLILLPALVFAAISGVRFKEALRLDKFRPVNIPIVIGIMIFAIPVATLLNVLNLLAVDSIFGKTVMTSLPAAENGVQLLVNILVIAGSAGICEEVLFRGVLQRSFERFGTAGSILLAALLFSLTHLDFQKILGTFALGALIGLCTGPTHCTAVCLHILQTMQQQFSLHTYRGKCWRPFNCQTGCHPARQTSVRCSTRLPRCRWSRK